MILDFHFMYRCYNITYNPVFLILYVHTYVKVYVNESKGENNYHH